MSPVRVGPSLPSVLARPKSVTQTVPWASSSKLEGLIQAVVNGLSELLGDLKSPWQQRNGREQGRKLAQSLPEEEIRLARLDLPRPFQNHQHVAHFRGEDVRGNQFMDALMVFIAEPDGLTRSLLQDVRLDVHGSVDDVFHWPLREARTASRVTS
jgi:hypothetical protein